jgi:hypothetical protein
MSAILGNAGYKFLIAPHNLVLQPYLAGIDIDLLRRFREQSIMHYVPIRFSQVDLDKELGCCIPAGILHLEPRE